MTISNFVLKDLLKFLNIRKKIQRLPGVGFKKEKDILTVSVSDGFIYKKKSVQVEGEEEGAFYIELPNHKFPNKGETEITMTDIFVTFDHGNTQAVYGRLDTKWMELEGNLFEGNEESLCVLDPSLLVEALKGFEDRVEFVSKKRMILLRDDNGGEVIIAPRRRGEL